MNPSKRGLGTAGKAGAVIILVIIALGAIYLVPKFTASSQPQASGPNAVPKQITGMPSLFYDFSQIQVSVDVNDVADGYIQNQSYSSTVLGKSTVNSVVYTRVEFSTVGVENNVVVWYNATGGINEVDVVGVRNYTGNGTRNLPFITTYSDAFGGLFSVPNNNTLLSLLSKTSEALTNIGPTQMDVTSYVLHGRSYPYSSLTLQIATIPGTDVQLLTYLDEKTTDGTTTVFQVTSLTR